MVYMFDHLVEVKCAIFEYHTSIHTCLDQSCDHCPRILVHRFLFRHCISIDSQRVDNILLIYRIFLPDMVVLWIWTLMLS